MYNIGYDFNICAGIPPNSLESQRLYGTINLTVKQLDICINQTERGNI